MHFGNLKQQLLWYGATVCGFLYTVYPHMLYAIGSSDTFGSIVTKFLTFLNLLVPIIFGLTFVTILWGAMQAWIINAGNSEKVQEGQAIVLWGVIGLVVMAGMWGIISILRTSFFV